ncbi:hypothetical protein DXI23_20075 [Marinobacter flavimaris]|jgi:hypothetical protein|uniref:Uncharacterized protein n=1 Tax=Marinobacter flavimaris TaxID=262076 RepID=A0A3D8GXE9_9GAMM|nr:hypothetical protein MDHKLMBL_19775 [Marinobacter flavimaris]RDU39114.1 hypothetical protein DXI23_20075 [Marinobacter flavimaris]
MISREEMAQIERSCRPYRVKINAWSASLNSEPRYYINLYSMPAGVGPCRTKLWFTDDNPKVQIDDRYSALDHRLSSQIQYVQQAINRFFEENKQSLLQRKRSNPNPF